MRSTRSLDTTSFVSPRSTFLAWQDGFIGAMERLKTHTFGLGTGSSDPRKDASRVILLGLFASVSWYRISLWPSQRHVQTWPWTYGIWMMESLLASRPTWWPLSESFRTLATAARFLGLFFIIFTDFALKNTLKLKLNQFCFYRLKIHHITGPLAYQTSTSFTVIVFFRIFAFGTLELFSFCSKYTPFLPILLPKTP